MQWEGPRNIRVWLPPGEFWSASVEVGFFKEGGWEAGVVDEDQEGGTKKWGKQGAQRTVRFCPDVTHIQTHIYTHMHLLVNSLRHLTTGYSKEEGQKQPWPVLYCNDGQNVFGDCETLSGTSWGVAHTAAGLISSGKLPPFLVVGLDHAGPLRSLEYTPYTPGTGPGGFRCVVWAGCLIHMSPGNRWVVCSFHILFWVM